MKSWAIVVGINEYPEAAGQGALKGAVADAVDFADWALDPAGGAVESARLFFWTYPEPDNPTLRLADYLKQPTPWRGAHPGARPPDPATSPTKDAIVETALAAGAAAREAAMADNVAEIRRIYVFFAGHGLQTNTTGSAMAVQTCFVAGDFRPDAMTVMGLIPCDDLYRALLGGGFDEVFMFLDCCRVAMTKLNMPAPNILSPNSRLPAEPVCCVGSAAQKNKIAFEIEKPPPPRGAFSKTLVEGLRTVRDPGTHQLTVESLKAYVYRNISTHITEAQFPNFVSDPDNPSPIVLTGPPIPQPQIMATIRISFESVAAGAQVQLSDDKGNPVGKPIIAGTKPAKVSALAERFYALDVLGTAISKPFRHPGPGVTDVSL